MSWRIEDGHKHDLGVLNHPLNSKHLLQDAIAKWTCMWVPLSFFLSNSAVTPMLLISLWNRKYQTGKMLGSEILKSQSIYSEYIIKKKKKSWVFMGYGTMRESIQFSLFLWRLQIWRLSKLMWRKGLDSGSLMFCGVKWSQGPTLAAACSSHGWEHASLWSILDSGQLWWVTINLCLLLSSPLGEESSNDPAPVIAFAFQTSRNALAYLLF